MGFFVFLLTVVLIWLWSKVSDLSGQHLRLAEQFAASKDVITELSGRVLRLERGTVAPVDAPFQTPVAPPAPSAEPAPAAAPARVLVPPPTDVRPPVPAPPVEAAVVEVPVVEAPPDLVTPPVVATPAVAAEPVVAASPTWSEPAVTPAASETGAPASAARTESWEMTVGTSWLNKIGVLVFIVGVALLVGYSFNHVGPAGRVAIGFILSAAMLAGGVVLERQPAFRNYAYGLVAGGWAGVYFTTFAMHDIPAARIVENDLLAVSLLSLVAAGMIAHSLRYRSQIVTSLAFIVAYTTLALSPVSGFSLAASVPLAVSLLLVSQRLGWAGVSALGIVATYGAFALRGAIFPEVLNPHSPLPYVMLATYWLAFETADITGLRSRGGLPMAGPIPVPMLALNATGLMGALLLTVPAGNPAWLGLLLFIAASAYVVSAVVRAWLLPGWIARHSIDEPFDTTHGATAIAAVLFAIAIDLRFTGDREILALLLLAQLLATAGLVLGDVWLRRMGSIGFPLAALYALGELGASGGVSGWPITTTSAATLLIAAACYGNREALHRREAQPVWVESVFTWLATLLVASVIIRELDPAHQAIAGLVVAVILLEVGFRRSHEYTYQSHVAGGFASYGLLAAFLAPPTAAGYLVSWGVAPTPLDEWIVLPAGVLLTAAAAWRLATDERRDAIPGWRPAAGACTVVSTAILLLFEWRVLPTHAIAPAWVLTAVALVVAGTWRRLPILRWQAYVISLAATMREVGPLTLSNGTTESATNTIAIAIVIAAVYLVAYLGRRALPPETATADVTARDSFEDGAVSALSIVATGSLVVFKWRVLPDVMVAPAWALTGLVLVGLGLHRARAGQRWQGYAVLAIGALRMMESLLFHPTASLDAVSSVSLAALVVIAATYMGAGVARRAAIAERDTAGVLIPILGTIVLAALESRILSELAVAPAWAMTGVALVAVGLWRRAPDLRWQAYALLALGTLRASQLVFGLPEPSGAAIAWLGLVIGALYLCGIVVRRMVRSADAGETNRAEDAVGAAQLLGATSVLALLILQEVRPSMITLALGAQGLALMFAGLIVRERVLRLSGLGLLLGCILKLFIYDLREREAVARIMSFVILGLILLAISWTYTKYREKIREFL